MSIRSMNRLRSLAAVGGIALAIALPLSGCLNSEDSGDEMSTQQESTDEDMGDMKDDEGQGGMGGESMDDGEMMDDGDAMRGDGDDGDDMDDMDDMDDAGEMDDTDEGGDMESDG
ncbi:hypothetical protein HNR23_001326 [Nocardiopsis mwathae]|uniref:DNA primase n=1 Tax=Nocardiopsis mwathae TaxID=1472723 RepID=A0A7W9YHD6_9ACTN|nr:hypothetical protein [Nocardiopsis mwathae]MBB6171266.1 hypothetical protein [Nocardiopsis mwathae]